MSTNNSEGNEINEGYNCVWNCNYCYHSLLSQGFSVSRCANGNDCHCLSGLGHPCFELTALSTCNYWYLLTKHSRSWETTGCLCWDDSCSLQVSLVAANPQTKTISQWGNVHIAHLLIKCWACWFFSCTVGKCTSIAPTPYPHQAERFPTVTEMLPVWLQLLIETLTI